MVHIASSVLATCASISEMVLIPVTPVVIATAVGAISLCFLFYNAAVRCGVAVAITAAVIVLLRLVGLASSGSPSLAHVVTAIHSSDYGIALNKWLLYATGCVVACSVAKVVARKFRVEEVARAAHSYQLLALVAAGPAAVAGAVIAAVVPLQNVYVQAAPWLGLSSPASQLLGDALAWWAVALCVVTLIHAAVLGKMHTLCTFHAMAAFAWLLAPAGALSLPLWLLPAVLAQSLHGAPPAYALRAALQHLPVAIIVHAVLVTMAARWWHTGAVKATLAPMLWLATGRTEYALGATDEAVSPLQTAFTTLQWLCGQFHSGLGPAVLASAVVSMCADPAHVLHAAFGGLRHLLRHRKDSLIPGGVLVFLPVLVAGAAVQAGRADLSSAVAACALVTSLSFSRAVSQRGQGGVGASFLQHWLAMAFCALVLLRTWPVLDEQWHWWQQGTQLLRYASVPSRAVKRLSRIQTSDVAKFIAFVYLLFALARAWATRRRAGRRAAVDAFIAQFRDAHDMHGLYRNHPGIRYALNNAGAWTKIPAGFAVGCTPDDESVALQRIMRAISRRPKDAYTEAESELPGMQNVVATEVPSSGRASRSLTPSRGASVHVAPNAREQASSTFAHVRARSTGRAHGGGVPKPAAAAGPSGSDERSSFPSMSSAAANTGAAATTDAAATTMPSRTTPVWHPLGQASPTLAWSGGPQAGSPAGPASLGLWRRPTSTHGALQHSRGPSYISPARAEPPPSPARAFGIHEFVTRQAAHAEPSAPEFNWMDMPVGSARSSPAGSTGPGSGDFRARSVGRSRPGQAGGPVNR